MSAPYYWPIESPKMKKISPTFPQMDSKTQKNGKISHFENLDFWLRFKRKSFETKPLLLVMVHCMFHIMKTFGLSQIWGSEKKHLHFKLKSNCDTVGIQQNPASHNPFGKFCLGIWIYFQFFFNFCSHEKIFGWGYPKNEVPSLLPIGVENFHIQWQA